MRNELSTQRMSPIEIYVEDLGICEQCGVVFSTGGLPPHKVALKLNCHACGYLISWQSLGKVCVGAGGIYTTVKWVGPARAWVTKKPQHSFFVGHWWVLPERLKKRGHETTVVVFEPPKTTGGRSRASLRYVVWCQKWGTINILSGKISHVGYSLHTTIKRLRDFLKKQRQECVSVPMDEPYQCLVSETEFRALRVSECNDSPTSPCNPMNFLPIPPPKPYVSKWRERNVFEILVDV